MLRSRFHYLESRSRTDAKIVEISMRNAYHLAAMQMYRTLQPLPDHPAHVCHVAFSRPYGRFTAIQSGFTMLSSLISGRVL